MTSTSTAKPKDREPGDGAEVTSRAEQALRFVEEADLLVSEVLPGSRWPQRRTIERFLATDRLERVLALYSRAMRLDPDEPAYPWNLAGVLSRLGLNDLALSHVERAIAVAARTGDQEWAGAGAYLAWAETALLAGQEEVALVALAGAAKLAAPGSAAESAVKRMVRDLATGKGDAQPGAALASDLLRLAG